MFYSSMDPGDRVANRAQETMVGGVLSIVVPVFASVQRTLLEQASPSNSVYSTDIFDTVILLYRNLPGMLTLSGFVAAAVFAGPLGIIGAVLEIIGVNLLFSQTTQPESIYFILIGAVLVVAGRSFWKVRYWFSLIIWLSDSSGRGGRRY